MRAFGMLVPRTVALVTAAAVLAGLAATPVAAATPSTTSLSAPGISPKPVGRTTSITATVTAGATGNVVFKADDAPQATVPLADGSATWTVPADLPAGTYSITADYAGDGTYDPSASSAVQLVVGPVPVIVARAVTGPRDATGATAQQGDVITVLANVTNNGGSQGVVPDPTGTVQVRVDGVVKATIILPAPSVDVTTATWAPGAHTIVAHYVPTGTDYAAADSEAWPITIAANTVDATGLPPSLATFYPYRDGYRDTTRIRGTRDEVASVSIAIYNSAGRRVRLLAAPAAIGAWSVAWNGRNSSNVQVAAGRYTIRQTVKDRLGKTKKLPATYVTVSSKRIYTYSVTLRKSLSQRSAGSPSKGWVGWSFTLPSATVYKKLVFGAYGKSGSVPLSAFGPHDKRYCSWSTWSFACINPVGYIPISRGWGNKTGNVTYNRSGRSAKMYVVALNSTTSVSTVRVVVTYGVLR